MEDFHRYISSYDRNYYLRWFSWPSSRNRPDKTEALKSIRQRLTVVGTTERLDDFLRLLSSRLGISLQPFRENPTKKMFGLNDLPPKTRRLLDEVSATDMEIYNAASERFQKEWKETFES